VVAVGEGGLAWNVQERSGVTVGTQGEVGTTQAGSRKRRGLGLRPIMVAAVTTTAAAIIIAQQFAPRMHS
jgi:hypothetical protein